ncbi:MAG: PadR family transcriptional regulator [Thermomicrobiales bacterium]
MSTTRLFILGALARIGPMHGHQIRREAHLNRTETWSNVKPGSLYGALQRMEKDGLIEVVRTEQEGNRPERTVYAITDAGRAEFASLRDAIMRDARLRPDPVDLAIQFLDDDLSVEEATLDMRLRLRDLEDQRAAWHSARQSADPYLNDLDRIVFEHSFRRIDLEIQWHREVLDQLPALLASRPPNAI